MRLGILVVMLFLYNTSNAQLQLDKTYDVGIGPMLHLLKDSMFYYGSVGCAESWISKGKWHVRNDSLILTSFDSIKCRPTFKLTPLNSHNDSTVTIITNSFGIRVYPTGKNEYISLDINYGITIEKGKYSHFELDINDTGNYKYKIPDSDINIESDYPSVMVDRYINYFALGTKIYIIKEDGIYLQREDTKPIYPFTD